jgi:SAM-dependent methyltransferase
MQQNTDSVTNLFVHRSAAQRYATARPYFHPLIAQRIISFTGVARFSHALDIARGTGQSSQALTEIAGYVDAVDVSPEMAAEAEPHERIRYHVSAAEALPFPDDTFDIATVGLAFHWFDQANFLREAHRVLKAGAWLVIYTSGFSGEMAEDSTFREWAWNVYPKRFPTPPRRSDNVTLEAVEPFGFSLRSTEMFAHDEKMLAGQLTDCLLTQTNVIAAVEGGAVPLAEAMGWIRDGIRPFFNDEARTMRFGGSMSFLRWIATA